MKDAPSKEQMERIEELISLLDTAYGLSPNVVLSAIFTFLYRQGVADSEIGQAICVAAYHVIEQIIEMNKAVLEREDATLQ